MENMHENQKLAIQKALDPNIKTLFINGAGGCVDCDTEFMSRDGWKKISEFSQNDDVLQWYADGRTEFVKPIRYVKVKSDSLIRLKSNTIDMIISDDHRIPYITSRGNNAVSTIKHLSQLSNIDIPRKFYTPMNTKGLGISEELLRVLVMQSADGSIVNIKKFFTIRIRVKKQRKIDRMFMLLDNANIPYSVHNNKTGDGFVSLSYRPPVEIAFKGLGSLWEANERDLSIISDEVTQWDGSIHARKNVVSVRFTGNKSDSDFIQYALSATKGRYCGICKDKREYVNGDIFNVGLSSRSRSNINFKSNKTHRKVSLSEYETKDGFQYCFETASSFWLARCNGVIFPTGNSGKSHVINHIVKSVEPDDIVILAPTQSASQNIGGDTIHSFFKIAPTINIEAEKEEDVLSFSVTGIDEKATDGKIVIVDEVSMLGEIMLKGILSRIKPKKLILVGDPLQLSPVKDVTVDWGKFCEETVTLTHNYRIRDKNLSNIVSNFRKNKILTTPKQKLEDLKFDTETVYIAFTNYRLSQLQEQFLGYTSAKYGDKLITFGQCADTMKRLVETHKGYKQAPYFVNNDTVVAISDKMFQIDERYDLYWCEVKRADDAPMVSNKYNTRPLVIVGDYDDYNKLLERRFKKVQSFQNKLFSKYKVANASQFKMLEAKMPFAHEYFDDLREYKVLWKQYFEIKNSPYARHSSFISVYKAQGKSFPSVVVSWDDMPSDEHKYVAISRAMDKLIII